MGGGRDDVSTAGHQPTHQQDGAHCTELSGNLDHHALIHTTISLDTIIRRPYTLLSIVEFPKLAIKMSMLDK